MRTTSSSMASPPFKQRTLIVYRNRCTLSSIFTCQIDADVIKGTAPPFIGQTLAGQDIDRGPAAFDPFTPPHAFADDLARYGAVSNAYGKVGLSPFIGKGHAVAVRKTVKVGIIGMNEEVHGMAGRQFIPFIKGRVGDAHIGTVDEASFPSSGSRGI